MRRRLLSCLISGLALASLPAMVQAQAYPSKPVRIIVPATAGGTSDIFARAIGQRLQDALGKPVIIEYKPGAATNIGTDYVAKSAPDGHTLLINGTPLVTAAVLFPTLPFDPAKDLVPVIEVAEMVNVVTVHPSVPVTTIQELVQRMRSDPGKFNYGTPGAGSSGHLSGELFGMKTGTKFTHIAYQGNAQATTDHIGGTLQIGFVNLPVALKFVKEGRLKALAVTSAKRSALLPDVPTVAEALGIDYAVNGWFGLVAPAKTPPEIVSRLNSEVAKVLKDPAMAEIISTAGGEVVGGSVAMFEARLRDDAARFAPVLRASAAISK